MKMDDFIVINMKMDDFNEGVDGKLASRMRKVNQEQFLTLVKMHLSFELDLNTDDNDCVTEKAKLKKWGLLSFSKKPKSTMNLQKGTDGANLTPEGISQVRQLIEYLSKESSLVQEGIFRRTGKLTRQQDLKTALCQGIPLELDNGPYSVHDCASVLKIFLAELSEPLLTELHYPAHCQIAELYTVEFSSATESRLLGSLQLLLLLLPPANRTLLRHLLSLLNKTAAFESSNKMNCDTLATLFTPHLMCPRKLSPEALHVDSQHLSGLVAFMIRKGLELFEIPQKLATDIRAYWVEQERKLLSPGKNDLNESTSDTTGTAHTVFSFVDHKLTAKANSTQDTQAALAQLYAHIQAMPESAKKRRLVKQFNKENGQGTPRHVKQYRTKSLGDSIKKHIFQNKLLGHKKLIDINTNTSSSISRSSSEENILSATRYEADVLGKSPLASKVLFAKSEAELTNIESHDNSTETESLARLKRISSSSNTARPGSFKSSKSAEELVHLANNTNSFTSSGSYNFVTSGCNNHYTAEILQDNLETSKSKDSTDSRDRLPRPNSEPPYIYSSKNADDNDDDSSHLSNDLVRHNSDPMFLRVTRRPNIEIVFTPNKGQDDDNETNICSSSSGINENWSKRENEKDSPVIKNKFWKVHAAHTSTPSDLLRRNMVKSDYTLTPITSRDKSMSPITRSTTKMSRAMQETMMTPRSRKPVMMISTSNLCNLASLEKSFVAGPICSTSQSRISSIERSSRKNCTSILEESLKLDGTVSEMSISQQTKNITPEIRENKENSIASLEIDCPTTTTTIRSITTTFRDYLLSRSVLTASPVDLSFTSRTGDFEQSESDLQIPNEEELSDSLLHCLDGNNPGSDTSGIASDGTNSANNSTEKIFSESGLSTSPRKRGTSLQRHDSKRSVKSNARVDRLRQQKHRLKHKQLSESTLNNAKLKENVQETSF